MASSFRSTLAAVFVVGIGLSVAAPSAQAQYFGRNRVQYESFDFKVLKTEHFDIHYYEEEAQAIEYAALMAERWYERLSRLLNHELNGRQKLILYASHPHFQQTNALGGQVDEGTQGATELLKRRMVMPFLGPFKETDHVIGHELVHAFQFDITGEGGGTLISGVPGAARMPLWFVEGMAEYLSVGHIDPETAMWMRATVEQDVPVDKYIEGRALHPYQHGQALWAYIAGRWGDDVVGRLLKATRTSPSVSAVFQRVLRIRPDELLKEWYTAMQEASHPLLGQTESPETYGTPILGRKSGSGYYNISPALSPRGDDLVYLSEKDLFAIEMFLADARTGEVKRKIVKTSVDAHFEGLQFVSSAGEWDRTGTQFAFAGVRKGKPSLTVMNATTGQTIHEKVFKDLGEIFNPSWSPTGRYIAFSAIKGGSSDLYTYDLEQDEVRRLTNDFHGDIHPAWSPDGQKIVFVTERFSSGLVSLMHGDYQLAIMDPQTGAIEEVQGFDRGKHINPQWSPDGRSLFFVSDQNGISNIYRLDMETNSIYQVTNLYTGVAGIAPLSPAISVASETGELAFSVFKGGALEIYLIAPPVKIVFVTERVSSGLVSVMHGDYQLAIMDPQTGAIEEVQGFDRGKHINPQWSPDGRSLFFVSDQNGISNIYRLDMETNSIYQVTNLYTGVAGIAPLSPAISVASETGELAFSVFKGGAIEIYLIDDPEVLAGGPVIDSYDGVDPAVLPPADRATTEVIALLNTPFFGLPSDRAYASSDYKPGFGLDYVGQPYLVVGASRFGTFVGGGTSLFFSDVLGGNNLATFFQINGGVKDISAGVTYVNLSKRLNWGLTAQQFSFVTGGFQTLMGNDPDVGQFFRDQQFRFRQINRDALLITSYPFSRVQRVEFQAGFRNISYDYEVRNTDFLPTGQIIAEETVNLASPDPLNG